MGTDSIPVQRLKQWLDEEQIAGAPNPQQAVLCTTTKNAIPHGRVVAIREINNEESLLFFTQKGTRKVNELTENPHATLVFWFELLQREVIIEGTVEALTTKDNQHYWENYFREAQIRFHSYAPTSSQPIANKKILEDKKKQLEQQYRDEPVPLSEFYCGFKFQPQRLIFYAYRLDELSDVIEYKQTHNGWVEQCLSP